MKILLASQSPRRRDLIRLTAANIDTLSTDIDETVRDGEAPAGYVARLSKEKAEAAANMYASEAPTIIVAADTTVVENDEILGKPADFSQAMAMLQRIRNRTHMVLTGITVHEYPSGRSLTQVAQTPLKARNFTDAEIEAYIATGDPFDKAGGYGIQHQGFHAIENFSHCFANVMGLPLCHLTRMLRELGHDLTVDITLNCQQHLDYACPVHNVILNGGEAL